MVRTTIAAALAGLLLAPLAPAQAADGDTAPALVGPRITNGCVTSVPDPGTDEPVEICWTMFRPVEATRAHKVPMILHSHGWGGSRTKDWRDFARWTEHGYAVLSYDQRGFGESGGHAYVENPAVEGRDVARLVRLISSKRWVRKDGPGDPRLGAIGGSYGGGYQFLGAFTSLQRRGKEVFDALAPQITWNSLNTSLAPEGVVRTEWAAALSAAAVPSDALPPHVYKALLEGVATGTWPDGSLPGTEDMESFFRKNGPAWHVRHGRRLRIPVLLGQGTTDSLFPLRQAITNWETALTRKARRHSIFVGYNGGHVLPAVFPRGVDVTSDPCSERLGGGSFDALTRRFFDHALKGRRTTLRGYGRLHLATPDSRCTTVRSARPNTTIAIDDVATTETAGAPIAVEIARGPIRVAGSARLTGTMTALGVNNRAFYGLAVGTSPADAHLVQNNVLPVNEPEPVVGERRRIRLPAVAVDVPAGQRLYLLASAFSDTFVGMGSRTPGAILLEDTAVHVRQVGR